MLNPNMFNDDQGAQVGIVHEGVHAGELMPGMATWNGAYALEHNAYETQSYFSQAIGYLDMISPSNGSDVINGVLDFSKDFVLWNPSWKTADAATIESHRSRGINAAAKDGADVDCARDGCKK
jgi:hypothetical protein